MVIGYDLSADATDDTYAILEGDFQVVNDFYISGTVYSIDYYETQYDPVLGQDDNEGYSLTGLNISVSDLQTLTDEQLTQKVFSGDDVLNGANDDFFDFFGSPGGEVESLYGYAGDDLIYGNGGIDHLFGGDGNDVLDGGTGDDALNGGSDRDIVDYSDATGAINFTIGAASFSAPGLGTDTLTSIEGVYATAFDDILNGNGTSNVFRGGAGDDVIDGKTGIDTVDFSDATGAINFTVGVTSFSAPGLGTDTLTSIEGVTGTGFNDTLLGDRGINFLNGDGGADTIRGDLGDDVINGGDGNDKLYGGRDNDTINGGDGNDRIYGGNLDDIINGDAGNDTLVGDAGSDTIHGGADVDRVYGGSTDDLLFGDEGTDLLAGSGGDDELNGGTGNDRLLGGPGNNTFIFDLDSGADRIFNFQDNMDTIQIDSGYGFANAAAVMAAIVPGGSIGQNAIIDLGGGNTINLVNFLLGGAHSIADLQNDIMIV